MVPMVPRTFAAVGMDVWGSIFGGFWGFSFFFFDYLFVRGVWEWAVSVLCSGG